MIENLPASDTPLRRMPAQRPGRSRQDWATPPEFLEAVKRRLRITEFAWDLAASPENAVADRYFTEADDALVQDWDAAAAVGWAWLNPPFGNMAPWVEKAAASDGVVMLVPAAVGANWWRDHVDRKARVWFLNGRITFVGATGPYPKDCALLLYDEHVTPGYEVWNWRAR